MKFAVLAVCLAATLAAGCRRGSRPHVRAHEARWDDGGFDVALNELQRSTSGPEAETLPAHIGFEGVDLGVGALRALNLPTGAVPSDRFCATAHPICIRTAQARGPANPAFHSRHRSGQ